MLRGPWLWGSHPLGSSEGVKESAVPEHTCVSGAAQAPAVAFAIPCGRMCFLQEGKPGLAEAACRDAWRGGRELARQPGTV